METPRLRTDDRDRRTLRALARSARGGILTVSRAAIALEATSRTASVVLAGLSRRGWLRRLRRGLYLVLPLEAESLTSGVVEDPWLLATELFSPCYIAGWT